MSDKYFTVNIRAYLDKDEPTYIGKESLYVLLSDFFCPKNPDVEYFQKSVSPLEENSSFLIVQSSKLLWYRIVFLHPGY